MRSTLLALCVLGTAAAGAPCEKLIEMTIPNVAIRSAAVAHSAPGADTLPPFCRVQAAATPVPDSVIEFEVWIPETWNGKFQGVGNGGYSGAISLTARWSKPFELVTRPCSRNTGHSGDTLKFGQRSSRKRWPTMRIRAVHVMTENAAPDCPRADRGASQNQSYFVGCSAGGHQALSEAQRYPLRRYYCRSTRH